MVILMSDHGEGDKFSRSVTFQILSGYSCESGGQRARNKANPKRETSGICACPCSFSFQYKTNSGIKNPVSVANRLLCEGQKGKLSAGRIPPCFLVGEGAYRWAVDHGIPACPPGIMATRFSLAAFKRNKRKLELAEKVETDLIQLKKRRQSNEKENDSGTLDTVGAVVVDQEGNVAAAVSSGGLALKHPGRVGQVVESTLSEPYWPENVHVLCKQKMPTKLS
ncbi:threonine aspartase 1 isoform x4 [Limosa lapponica baueri]|uniref:Threonine aspartase 1 isoform x4 n=1 Tax=Limosa lapponica baueri TaxID=1758121 RepID=A0A2I0TU84_LIMLA|nr:threonine aspartase 1 isoform x4 [Limosa lapponica baueri]